MRSVRPPGAPGTEVPRAALVGIVAVVGLGLVAAALPETPAAPALCLFKAVTGHPCPACGFLRAARHLVRGDIPGAFVMNPLDAAAMLLLPPAVLAGILLRARGARVTFAAPPRARTVLWWLTGAIVGSNWLYVLAAGR